MEKLQPTLRFPEFKGDWFHKKLGDISVFLDGKRKPIKSSDRNLMKGDFPYYGASGIIDYVNDFIFDEEIILLGEDGENIISRNLPLAFKVKGKCWVNNHAHVIKPNDNYDIDFLTISLENKSYVEYNSGTAQPKLNQEICRKIPLIFPLFDEQTKIANFITSVDEKLNLLKEKKALLEEYKKGMMQQIFSQQLRFKDEDGKDFEDWEEKSLGEIGNTFNGLTGKTKENFGTGKPYIQYKQIFDNSKINIEKCEFVEISEKENQNSVQYGDVFFTVSSETPNEIGTASVLLDKVEEMYLNSFCFGFRANSLQELVPEFSRYLFRNEFFRNDIVKLAQGSTRFNMSKIELMKLKVALPCSLEQTKIANFLAAIDEKITTVAEVLEATQEYKRGLLQGMFC